MRKDLWFALRNLTRNPGLAVVAILTLALGIGANTAVFSVLYAVLLRPLPLREPDRLTMIWAAIPSMNINLAHFEYNTFVEFWRPRNRSFEGMAAYSPGSANLLAGDAAERVDTMRVSGNYFGLLGVRPILGRDFTPEEDRPGAPRVAILSHKLWAGRFGSDRKLLGRSIVLDQDAYTVIGVLPATFDLAADGVFYPIAHSGARGPGMPSVGAYARLKPGVTLAAAQQEMKNLSKAWLAAYPYPRDWGANVWLYRDFAVRNVRASILVLSVAVALVLLIACANVANLLMARAGARQREIAIRVALGAGRGRLVRQLLTESALLGCIAAGLGLLLAWGAVRALVAAEAALPYLEQISVNAPVLAFTVAATLLTTLLFGLAPALSGAGTGLSGNLKEGGRGGESRGHKRFRSALVVAEVALALLLVIGATLTIRSISRLLAVDPGFRPEAVLTASINLPRGGYAEAPKRVAFFNSLLERLRAAPGVTAAGMANHLPFSGSKAGSNVEAENAPPPRPGEQNIAFHRSADPDYFRTMQIRLLRGRFFTPQDPQGGPVAIVNQTLARRLWPDQDPVGKRFRPGRNETPITVVGLIADVRSTSLSEEPDLEVYFPYTQGPAPGMSLVVRTALPPEQLAATLRTAVRELDRALPVSEVQTLSRNVERSTASRRLTVTLLGGFAGLALLLAAVGIYGVVAYSVTRRIREIGVRMALGATGGRIASMVVSQALLLGGLGVVLGLAGALGLTRLLRSMLFGVSATDPATFAAASLFLLAICGLAAWIPARRAAAVDPLESLRQE